MARSGGERVHLHELLGEALPQRMSPEDTVTVSGPSVSLCGRPGGAASADVRPRRFRATQAGFFAGQHLVGEE